MKVRSSFMESSAFAYTIFLTHSMIKDVRWLGKENEHMHYDMSLYVLQTSSEVVLEQASSQQTCKTRILMSNSCRKPFHSFWADTHSTPPTIQQAERLGCSSNCNPLCQDFLMRYQVCLQVKSDMKCPYFKSLNETCISKHT